MHCANAGQELANWPLPDNVNDSIDRCTLLNYESARCNTLNYSVLETIPIERTFIN